jgi:hypothetical protein
MFTALVAVLAACVLMLGLVNVAMADKGGNGTQSTATTAPGDSSQGGGSNSTATSGPGNSSQGCDGSHNSDTGNGANHSGPYDNTCDGSPSGNGNGNGNATGKPCAGCVGNADDKNPQGQYPNGSDHNAGYECDRNHGIGRTNPAHTGCKTETPPPPCTSNCSPCTSNCSPCKSDCSPCKSDCSSCTTNCSPCTTNCGSTTTTTTPTTTPPTTTNQQTVQGISTTGSTPTPTTTTGTPSPPQQEVLGERQSGKTPSSSNTNQPASTSAPEEAVQAKPASAAQHGSLPFTGTDVIAIVLAGCLMLTAGLGIRRLLANRA